MSAPQDLSVFITIDTESFQKNGNPDHEIWGRHAAGDEGHGIGRIMDLLEDAGARGTFFLTPYECVHHGEQVMGDIARAIHQRGHDLELHTHPIAQYRIDYMSEFDEDEQVEILEHGLNLLETWTGKRPTIHRAGGFFANRDTLRACARAGIKADSSYCQLAPRTPLSHELAASNAPMQTEGVIEIPATQFIQGKLGPKASFRLVDLEAASLNELKRVIRQSRRAGVPAVNVLMHSFSFVRGPKPDLGLEQRLAALLAWINCEPGVRVETMQDWLARSPALPAEGQASNYTVVGGWHRVYLRAIANFNRGRMNRIVALAPLAPLSLVALAWAFLVT